MADSELLDVVALGPADVWAVGDETVRTGAGYTPLVEHWNGTT